jgi:hypothetical protein
MEESMNLAVLKAHSSVIERLSDQLNAARIYVSQLQQELKFAKQDAEWHRQAVESLGRQLTAAHKQLEGRKP